MGTVVRQNLADLLQPATVGNVSVQRGVRLHHVLCGNLGLRVTEPGAETGEERNRFIRFAFLLAAPHVLVNFDRAPVEGVGVGVLVVGLGSRLLRLVPKVFVLNPVRAIRQFLLIGVLFRLPFAFRCASLARVVICVLLVNDCLAFVVIGL